MVHYIRHGRGDPLFLIHGLPKFGYTRQKNVPVLAEKFDISVPEVTTYAEDLLALANHHIPVSYTHLTLPTILLV